MLNHRPFAAVFGAVICLLVLWSARTWSEEQSFREYRVQKGDTLWDISGREFQEPFQWPRIWKENPSISNPDRIYPDQIIRLPVQKAIEEVREQPPQPEPAAVQAPPPVMPEQKIEVKRQIRVPLREEPIVSKNVYMTSGYIADSLPVRGRITGSPLGRNVYGEHDTVYGAFSSPPQIGEQFYVVRFSRQIFHPTTNGPLGTLVEILGTAKVSRFENGDWQVVIGKSYSDILINNLLIPYFEMEPPVIKKPYRKPNVQGHIVAAKERVSNATLDIVYIDRGKRDGVEPGDIFKTVISREQHVPPSLHVVTTGALQVISTRENTSTAIIRQSSESIIPGYHRIVPYE